jgi:tetraacyldisaccharide 4'-kinase
MAGVALAVERAWYGSPGPLWLLTPLELLFALATSLRRWLFQRGLLASHHPGGTVAVVGNLTAGGSGKTPVVIALASALCDRGLAVAVICRGYGGDAEGVVRVYSDSDVRVVGDEPLLLATQVSCPVYVARDRVAAARKAREEGADVLLCDDGLQHYRLRRDIEIPVLDARAPGGNGHLLPVGPLREGLWRVETVDFLLEHGGACKDRALLYAPLRFRSLASGECRPPGEPAFGPRVHALAAIARPARFFRTLTDLGFDVLEHPLPDHATISAELLASLRDHTLVVTSKDEPKIPPGVHPDIWVLEMDLLLPEAFLESLCSALQARGAVKS